MFRFKAVLFVLPALLLAGNALAAPGVEPQNICVSEARALEERDRIPHHLLSAISVVETGRWDEASKASFAWPWTVTAEGRGRYFPDKAAAIAEVRRLQKRGVTNIDVGCMQINLKYHPQAFASLDEAFTPQTNVAYAAEFLKRLYGESRVWTIAAAHYHSYTPENARKYRTKLLKEWSALQAGKYATSPQLDSPEPETDGIRQASFSSAPSKATREYRNVVRSLSDRRPEKARPTYPPKYQAERAQAKAFAVSWREAKLAEYQARKEAQK